MCVCVCVCVYIYIQGAEVASVWCMTTTRNHKRIRVAWRLHDMVIASATG